MKKNILSQAPLFDSLPADEIDFLARSLNTVELPPGQVIFREGETGESFYIIIEGRVEIIKELGKPDEYLLATRGSGEYVGEMSLINRDGLRTATVRTRTACHLFELTRADFDSLLHRHPTLAYEMVRVLSERLNQSNNQTVQEMFEKNRQLSEAYESLKAAQAKLIQQERLEREIQLASDLQASLLPCNAPDLPGWQFATCWLPARNVSGDFYDFIPLRRPGIEPPPVGVVIADVADKGFPAAIFMAATRSTVRASVSGPSPANEAIGQANDILCADSTNGLFVTLFYLQLDPLTGEFIYVNAGHNPGLLYKAESDQWLELSRTGMALGIMEQRLEQRSLQMEPGDLLLLYTDGVTDLIDPQVAEFGLPRLHSFLKANVRSSAYDLAAGLEAALMAHCAGQPIYDDVTFVVIKREMAYTVSTKM